MIAADRVFMVWILAFGFCGGTGKGFGGLELVTCLVCLWRCCDLLRCSVDCCFVVIGW